MRMLVWVVALGVAAQAAPAQQPRLSLRFDLANVWARSDAPGSSTALSGPALGGEGRMVFGRFFVSVRYLEGRLQASNGAAGQAHQELVDGAILLAAKPFSWLELAVGPAARAYVTDSTTERWTVWRVRTRVEAPLAQGLSSYVELWRAFQSDVNVAAGPGRVLGGETGLVYRPRGRYSVRFAYHIDDALLGVPGRSDTLESLTVGVAIERF
jgi:hypothetical protein